MKQPQSSVRGDAGPEAQSKCWINQDEQMGIQMLKNDKLSVHGSYRLRFCQNVVVFGYICTYSIYMAHLANC